MLDDDDPFGSSGLSRIHLSDKPVFDQFFSTCRTPLSDYTFANTFAWRDPIHLRWRILHDCLCVFANGDGGLTMLFPPLGNGDASKALREALAICDHYNERAHLDHWTRVEYVSGELMDKLHLECEVSPMSGDYYYLTERMIDLAGSDLASKRQARNRFARRYAARTEPLGPQHVEPCLDLLATWQEQAQQSPVKLVSSVQFKRSKEVSATAETLYNARALGLAGMVLYADDKLIGFTLGELLAPDTCSILIEKTDREYVGSAQYIFSEFCRQYWSHTRWCNVGDDWEIPSLAWTKQSYRPAGRLEKYVLRPLNTRHARVSTLGPGLASQQDRGEYVATADLPGALCLEMTSGDPAAMQCATGLPGLDLAGPDDLDDLMALECKCFAKSVAMSRRQLRYLLNSPRATVHVLRQDGHVIAAALLLRRRTRTGATGRLYSIAVDNSCRGKGYGRSLLKNCLNVLRRDGVETLMLEVDVENQPAISLYESAGFIKLRRLRDYYSPGKDAWKMRLKLNKPAPAPQAADLLNEAPAVAVPVNAETEMAWAE